MADLDRLAEVRLLHEVDAVLDAVEVGARDVEGDRVHRAGGDRDPVEVALELVEGDVGADRRVEDERDAEALDEPDVHLDRFARQAERRHADEHRPAAVREAVEDRDLVALGRELARDRDPGRPRTDDRDPLLARRDLGHDVGDARGLVPLDEEALHRPDRQRAIDVAAAAGPLARRGADVRAHRGDRVRFARQDVALLEPALGGEVEVAAAVRPDRARFLAFDVALEPGGVDGLDEEFLGLLDGQAGVPFPDDRTRARTEDRRGADARNLPSAPRLMHDAAFGVRASPIGRRWPPRPKLTPPTLAATLAGAVVPQRRRSTSFKIVAA